MAMAMAKSGLQSALRRSGRGVAPPKRNFSASSHDEHETAKWEKITIVGIITSVSLAVYNLSRGHPHFPDPPPYPYLHIRNKEFPWGPDGLFEVKHDHH